MNDTTPTSDRLLATSRPRQPYPGLRPFEMEEWSIFFGRERMIDDVVELLARQRLVVVHGSSGSGKSSLIRAGVLPRLARQHLRHGVPWRTCAMRPSGGPLWNLAAALADMEGKSEDIARVDEIRLAFDRPDARLDHIVRDVLGVEGQRTCILVDQFEELFRYARETNRDESQLFIELLGDLLVNGDEGGVHAVVTMRSEFLGECARYDGLAEAINRTQYLLPRMNRDDLLRAIRRPAEVYGGNVEADLAERLIAEAGGGQDALPLIQHALMLLWRRASAVAKGPPRLDLALYRRRQGGIAALLSDHADQVLADAAPDKASQRVAERLFRALTDLNVEGQGIRRPQRFDRLMAVTEADRETLLGIIHAFRAEGVSFLTPYPPKKITDSDTIDISHEALIRCWRRVADPNDGWLQREFQDGLTWRSLLVRAGEFERNRKDVLPPTLTEERGRWMEGRPAAWCERYDGGWRRVADLMRASKNEAARIRRREAWRRRASWAPLVLVAAVGAWKAGEYGVEEWRELQRNETWKPAIAKVLEGEASDPVREWNCDLCPKMVAVPAKSFKMGSPDTDQDAAPDEKPRHPVTIDKPFAVGMYEVTRGEYATFVESTGYEPGPGCWVWTGVDWKLDGSKSWRDPGFEQKNDEPVTCVSWNDARAYTDWLSVQTDEDYRLLTEAEWEYAVRAGTEERYATGDTITEKDANFGENVGKTTEVGSYRANAWGLHDMHGNVWEWVADCFEEDAYKKHEEYPEMVGDLQYFCLRVLRGGSWINTPWILRSANRDRNIPDVRYGIVGFRVARTLN